MTREEFAEELACGKTLYAVLALGKIGIEVNGYRLATWETELDDNDNEVTYMVVEDVEDSSMSFTIDEFGEDEGFGFTPDEAIEDFNNKLKKVV